MEIEARRDFLDQPPYAYPKTREFLMDAISIGAFIIPEDLRDTKKGERLVKANNIVGTYYMTYLTLFDVGALYGGLTKEHLSSVHESVRQIIQDRLRQIWDANPTLAEKYPWEELNLGKPPSINSRMRFSLAFGGTSIKIIKQLEQGISDLDQIAFNINVNRQNVSSRRRVLEGWGLKLPRKIAFYKEDEERFAIEEDNVRLQILLDELPAKTVINYARPYVHSGSFLCPLGRALEEAGYTYHNLAPYCEAVRKAGLPIRELTHPTAQRHNNREFPKRLYVLLTKRKEESLEAIRHEFPEKF